MIVELGTTVRPSGGNPNNTNTIQDNSNYIYSSHSHTGRAPNAGNNNNNNNNNVVTAEAVQRKMNRTERMAFYRKSSKCGGCLLILLIIVFASCYSSLEYNEIGFRQRKTSGKVYRDKTYTSGRYFLGPDNTFVVYPASIVSDFLRNLEAWTRATVNQEGEKGDAGTSLVLDIGYQYTLLPDQLDQLYDKVGLEFKGFVKNIALSAIKNNATIFSSDEFIMDRRNVEKHLRNAVSEAFLQKANVKLQNFQLRNVKFPDSFMDRKLAGAIQELKNDAETYRKEARLTRAETKRLVQLTKNKGYLTREKAKAEAVFIKEKSLNQAASLKQSARHKGLKLLAKALNITKQKEIISLDYLFSMLNGKTELYIDFDNIVKSV